MFASGNYTGGLALVSGPLSGATAGTAAFAGKMLVLASPRLRGADRQRVFSWKPTGVVLLTTAPDSIWSQIVSRNSRPQLRDPSRQTGSPVVLGIRAASLQPVAAHLGADLAAAQSATAFEVKPLGGRSSTCMRAS